MPSAKLVLAAQTNGKKSRAPKTREGKRKSAANTREHGFFGKCILSDGECAQDFQSLHAACTAEYRPVGDLEGRCVRNFALAAVRNATFVCELLGGLDSRFFREACQARDLLIRTQKQRTLEIEERTDSRPAPATGSSKKKLPPNPELTPNTAPELHEVYVFSETIAPAVLKNSGNEPNPYAPPAISQPDTFHRNPPANEPTPEPIQTPQPPFPAPTGTPNPSKPSAATMRTVRRRHATGIFGLCAVIFALGLGTLGICVSPARAQTQDLSREFEGKTITRIAWDPATQPLAMSELVAMIPLRRDEPYRAAAVRATIERLYATGRYHDIQVQATSVDGGVAIQFITQNSWFIGHVGVQSDFSEPPSVGQLVSSSRLDLGVPFDEAQVAAAEASIRKVLTDNGYFDPELSHRFQYDTTYQQVNVTFVVKTGKRAHYEAPKVDGDTSVLSADAIDKATRWRRLIMPGYRGITQSRTRSGIDDVRRKFENADRLLATVTLDGIEPDAERRTGLPTISVDPGAIVEIKAEGANVSRKALRQNVPVFEEHTVDPDLLTEGSANLRDYFQARGYFDVEVEYKQTQVRDGKTSIDYIVTPGIRHRFTHLEIDGNKYFSEKTIRERMFLIPSSFEFRLGRYSEALRRRDENAIADLYQSNGFRDVKVTSRVEDDYNGRKGDEAVFFTIAEGPQYRVASLFVNGAKSLDLSKTIESLSSQPGQVYSEFNIAIDRETIIRRYGDSGIPNPAFSLIQWTSPSPSTKASGSSSARSWSPGFTPPDRVS